MASHILIIEAPFYQDITESLVNGATQVLDRDGVTYDRISVPGAYEIPGVIRFADTANAKRYDGYVAIGCVIRGETSHYDYVAGESCRALMDLALENLAIGNGILTVENKTQARVRSDITQKNKGGDAAEACLAMIRARDTLFSGKKL
ncbi:MAG: 6,7-dimethyl-8-ribityllumazine synthase [Magnetovibrio sp.]|nr:6,7-dimethyl-8-ribityllumazine synthase [Magnetovibrio sp.]